VFPADEKQHGTSPSFTFLIENSTIIRTVALLTSPHRCRTEAASINLKCLASSRKDRQPKDLPRNQRYDCQKARRTAVENNIAISLRGQAIEALPRKPPLFETKCPIAVPSFSEDKHPTAALTRPPTSAQQSASEVPVAPSKALERWIDAPWDGLIESVCWKHEHNLHLSVSKF